MRRWEKFAGDLADRILSALDYFCWNVSGDSPLECYSAHADLDLYELAEEFAEWSTFGIKESDLERLREMPDEVYDKYTKMVQREIERTIREIKREFYENDYEDEDE